MESFSRALRPERAQRAWMMASGCREFLASRAQGCDGGGFLAFDDEPLGGVAIPGVGMFQKGDEVVGCEFSGWGRGIFFGIGAGLDSPDSAFLVALAKIYGIAELFRDKGGVLDPCSAKIDEIEGPVGPIGEIYRPEPWVCRGEELAALLDPAGMEGGAVGDEFAVVHEAAEWLAEEGMALIGGAELSIAIDDGSAGGIEEGDRFCIEPFL